MHKVKNLKLWDKAIDLTIIVYKAVENFPKSEMYGLASQVKRCAVSIPSNISEGSGRNSGKDFIYFLAIANGSSYELETQLIIANKLGWLANNDLQELTEKLSEIQKMNYRLQEAINKKVTR